MVLSFDILPHFMVTPITTTQQRTRCTSLLTYCLKKESQSGGLVHEFLFTQYVNLLKPSGFSTYRQV
jgi:hypothetical protein